jgi:SAM-dependent methyltransferase
MKKVVKFSKNYNNLISIKKSLYNDNKKFLNTTLKVNKALKKQGLRKYCKNCESKLSSRIFTSFGLGYTLCKKCNHLNSIYHDNKKFTHWLYSADKGKNYDEDKDYHFFNQRVKEIHLPKVDFLRKVVKSKMNVLDIGAGSGQFLKALEMRNIKGTGYEPSKTFVKYGNKILKKNKLVNLDMQQTFDTIIKDKKSNVLSMICVLAHLEEPNELIEIYKKSNIKYLFFSVPLFSLSVFLENSFKDVCPRHLGAAHTNLYTKKSLYYLAKKFNLDIAGEWWFGADFPDLYRSLINTCNANNPKKYKILLDENLFSVINELQNVLDKNKMCSEVHMVFKKK